MTWVYRTQGEPSTEYLGNALHPVTIHCEYTGYRAAPRPSNPLSREFLARLSDRAWRRSGAAEHFVHRLGRALAEERRRLVAYFNYCGCAS